MSGSKSKNKGNAFEREIANFMSKTYNESFVRAAHSGAFIGGTNNHRKRYLSENQIKSFKGDIIPPDDWKHFNAEAKSYAVFPFHLMLTGDCKQLDAWLGQLLDVEDEGDLNILFMKFNRIGQYIAVQPKLTWKMDNYIFYSSKTHGDWLVTDFNNFFKHNQDLVKLYSGSTDTTSKSKDSLITINT